ncbi:uncharacterized protein LOC121404008 [Drosophila obscura]|uniref:uncharacterized protein LOC121404008 n=1 Tax=Drosophila obscura TaxID=7282 RepID=UPI001BB18FCC|nr:uncharacterized protein LOC121404008 [Drosophila obscura]
MSDTSGQPGKSPAPEAKPEGREFLDEGSKEDLLADTQVIRRSLESQLDKLREEKRWAEQCNTQLKIDLDKIKKRYNALESDFEAMVLEKELKIHSLELAQIRCQQLEPENVRQQQYITQLEARQATLENTNAQLNRHLNDIVAEMSSLKDILLKNNKSRVGFFCRDNTVTLKNQLEGRDKEMHLLIEQEHETLNTVATLYEEKTRLQLRIVQMEKKWGRRETIFVQKLFAATAEYSSVYSQTVCAAPGAGSAQRPLGSCPNGGGSVDPTARRDAGRRNESQRTADVDNAKFFDVKLQLDDSLTLQSLCARTPTVDISTTQQSVPSGLKRNAVQYMAFIKLHEKQGASSDAMPTHSNKKHFC